MLNNEALPNNLDLSTRHVINGEKGNHGMTRFVKISYPMMTVRPFPDSSLSSLNLALQQAVLFYASSQMMAARESRR